MFAIGDKEWPGISKLIEECGETLQVCGKLIATGGEERHWDGSNLHKRLEDELADLKAAILFVCDENCLDGEQFEVRVQKKLARFRRWHELGLTNLLTLRDVACVVCAQLFEHGPFARPERVQASGEKICVNCAEAGK